jgi:hypothetical protein
MRQLFNDGRILVMDYQSHQSWETVTCNRMGSPITKTARYLSGGSPGTLMPYREGALAFCREYWRRRTG